MQQVARVSVHGGHSGQFCDHASDTLEDVVRSYITHGFSWVGLTEHTPAVSDRYLYPDEREAGLTPEDLLFRFAEYVAEARRLQKAYSDEITLYVGMEIETCEGYLPFVQYLCETYRVDYIVGSVHFVGDIAFDYSPALYKQALQHVGGVTSLYCEYFDQQLDMLQSLNPSVVGHFDLIRLFDEEYAQTMRKEEVWQRILRNLEYIRENDLILDVNLRALKKGASEPYVSFPILQEAARMNIAVVPGDDTHGAAEIGQNYDKGVEFIRRTGSSTAWKSPRLLQYP